MVGGLFFILFVLLSHILQYLSPNGRQIISRYRRWGESDRVNDMRLMDLTRRTGQGSGDDSKRVVARASS